MPTNKSGKSVFAEIAELPFDPLEESDENEPLTKPKAQPKTKDAVVKEKKQKTAAQMASFQKTAEIRRNNIEARKQQQLINSAELLLATKAKAVEIAKPPKAIKKHVPVPEPVLEPNDDESEEENEIIIVKSKPKKPKKKITKIIIESSDSDSGSSTDDGGAPVRQERVSVQRRQEAPPMIRRAPNYFF